MTGLMAYPEAMTRLACQHRLQITVVQVLCAD
jgi:hypothetical protein